MVSIEEYHGCGKGEGNSQKEWQDRKEEVREERRAKEAIENKEQAEREVRRVEKERTAA